MRLRDQMLGAAEADFQAQFVDGMRKQRAQIGRRGPGEVERERRQQRVEQRGLTRLERMALAAAEKGALRLLVQAGSISLAYQPRRRDPVADRRQSPQSGY